MSSTSFLLKTVLPATAVTFAGVYALSSPQSPETAENITTMDRSVYYSRCAEARAAGAAPIYRGEPGYRSKLDRENDGVACEPYRRTYF